MSGRCCYCIWYVWRCFSYALLCCPVAPPTILFRARCIALESRFVAFLCILPVLCELWMCNEIKHNFHFSSILRLALSLSLTPAECFFRVTAARLQSVSYANEEKMRESLKISRKKYGSWSFISPLCCAESRSWSIKVCLLFICGIIDSYRRGGGGSAKRMNWRAHTVS